MDGADTKTRRREFAVLAFAVAAAAALSVWTLASQRGDTRASRSLTIEATQVEVVDTQVGRPPKRETARDFRPGGQGEPDETVAMHVAVRDSRTGEPLPGALVVAYRQSRAGALQLDGVILARSVAGSATTDEEGRVTLDMPAAEGPWNVQGSGPLHLPAVQFVEVAPGQPASVELRLRRGHAEISGLVVDSAGSQLPHVYVRALPKQAPDRSPEFLARVHEASFRSTRTDEAGRFRMAVEPDRAFHLDAYGDGFAEPPPGTPLPVPHLVRAGASGVRLVLDRVRMFRARLVSSVDGTPIAIQSSIFGLVLGPNGASVPVLDELVFAGSKWLRTYARSDDPSVYEGCVRIGGSGRTTVQLALAVPFFKPCSIAVALHLPSKLARSDAGQEIRLVPNDGVTFGRLRARVSYPRGNYWIPAKRFLYVSTPGAGLIGALKNTIISGRPVGHDLLEFDHVPKGQRTLTLSDGVTVSNPVELYVRENKQHTVEFLMRGPTGVTLEALDASSGTPLFDIEAVFVAQDQLGKGKDVRGIPARHCTQVHWSGSSGELLRGVDPLAPGNYRIVVAKPGYVPASKDITVAQGRLTHAVLRLSPIP